MRIFRATVCIVQILNLNNYLVSVWLATNSTKKDAFYAFLEPVMFDGFVLLSKLICVGPIIQ